MGWPSNKSINKSPIHMRQVTQETCAIYCIDGAKRPRIEGKARTEVEGQGRSPSKSATARAKHE